MKDVKSNLIPLVPAEGSLCSGGGSTGGSSLHSGVGNDSVGELLLGLGEAGPGPSVLRVDLVYRKIGTDKGSDRL